MQLNEKTSHIGNNPVNNYNSNKNIPLLIQGGSLRTWSYRSPAVEQVQVVFQLKVSH